MPPVIRRFLRKVSNRSGYFALGAAAVFVFSCFGAGFKSAPNSQLSFDPKLLLKQFEAAQQTEMNHLISHEKRAAKRFRAAQAQQQKDFNRREKESLRQFFAASHTGPEKRAYVQEMVSRRKAFQVQLVQARINANRATSERVQALRDEQQLKHRKFQDELGHNERPEDALWPQPTLETD